MIPLLMLPGMMCTADLFSPQLRYFSSQRCVQVAALQGHHTVQALAQDVLKNAPSEFALCGLSMGGIVAMEVIRQAPQRVKGLALLDTNPLAELEEVKTNRLPQIQQAHSGKLSELMQEQMIPKYLARADRHPDIINCCIAMAELLGPNVFEQQSLALRDRPDQCESLRQVSVPSLVLMGAQDQLCPLDRHQLMHQLIPQSQLVIIDNAGHLPVLEQAKETNYHLYNWLQDCDKLT